MPDRYHFRVLPAIDILNGKVVRLHQGDFEQRTFYDASPLSVAQSLESAGHKFLHLVDLDGAKAGQPVNIHLLEKLASETNLKIDFGGGLRKKGDYEIIFAAGASHVTLGSVAIKNEEHAADIFDLYGPDKVFLGADVKGSHIAISGWTESATIEWPDFLAKWVRRGVETVISTDVSKDGAMGGPSFELYGAMRSAYPELNIIASGGVSSYSDLAELTRIGCKGAIVGKALHDGVLTAEGLAKFNMQTSPFLHD